MKKSDLSPEQWKKNLACSRAWKKKNADKVKEYDNKNRARRLELERERRKKYRQENAPQHQRALTYNRKWWAEKRKRRIELLALMTPRQKSKFLENERQIRKEKQRLKKINKALELQSSKLNRITFQKERVKLKVQEVIEMQMANRTREKEQLERKRIDAIIEKVQVMRLSRAQRYKIEYISPRDRYLWAIDYYYELLYQDMKAA